MKKVVIPMIVYASFLEMSQQRLVNRLDVKIGGSLQSPDKTCYYSSSTEVPTTEDDRSNNVMLGPPISIWIDSCWPFLQTCKGSETAAHMLHL